MGFDVGGIELTSNGTIFSMGVTPTSWMQVNTSGILTRPQTPYMRGQLAGRGTPYAGNPLLVTGDVNIGGCWNNATGKFTCPVAGKYMMTGAGIANYQAGYFYLQKNAVNMHFTHWNHGGGWHYVTLSAPIACAAGDTLSYAIGGTTPATGVGFYGDGGHGMYSIALMA